MIEPLPCARQNNLVVQELNDEVLVYDLANNTAHCLNATAAFVWRRCDGTSTAKDIAAAFARSWNCDSPQDLVSHAIVQLEDSHLLASHGSPGFTSPSRRQLIKKLGLAAAVALPIVQSLVTPTRLYASVNCVCIGNNDCVQQPGCPTMCNTAIGQCQ